jgi:hypothetical protein
MEVLIIGLTTWVVIPMLVLIILLNVDKGDNE